jgi:integrase/recombinase XerD
MLAVVVGPLAPYADRLRAEMAGRGFTTGSVYVQLREMGRFSGWLAGRNLQPQDVTPLVIEEFVAYRAEHGSPTRPHGLAAMLGHLRELGVVPGPEPREGNSSVDLLIGRYRDYLTDELDLSAGTVRAYGERAKVFLAQLGEPLEEALAGLSAGQVVGFVLDYCPGRAVDSAKLMVTSLRSVLRFLHVQGLAPGPLAGAVPGVASSHLASLPRGLPAGQVHALLAAHDMATAAGRRDYAIVLLLVRLGLRVHEAAALELSDVNWYAGELTVHGKGGRIDVLPLPADVGEALVAYLTDGRPRCASGKVFIRVHAPQRGMTCDGMRNVVRRACVRAGLPGLGAHRLRHTLGSDLLAAGASLEDVGQVLRHRTGQATATYAKVDFAALAGLVRPWPDRQTP